MNPEKLVFYIDGFNLYFGLKEKKWRRYYWLNLQEMCSRLVKHNQQLERVRYFTARISGPYNKRLRQKTYLQALETLPLVEIHYGIYLSTPVICTACNKTFVKPSEKKTDVNIAVKMITDALDDLFDIAVLISADSDITPGIEAIKTHFPTKKVLLFFPPERSSASLKSECHRFGGTLRKSIIKKSQFPNTVVNKLGYSLTRPTHWS